MDETTSLNFVARVQLSTRTSLQPSFITRTQRSPMSRAIKPALHLGSPDTGVELSAEAVEWMEEMERNEMEKKRLAQVSTKDVPGPASVDGGVIQQDGERRSEMAAQTVRICFLCGVAH